MGSAFVTFSSAMARAFALFDSTVRMLFFLSSSSSKPISFSSQEIDVASSYFSLAMPQTAFSAGFSFSAWSSDPTPWQTLSQRPFPWWLASESLAWRVMHCLSQRLNPKPWSFSSSGRWVFSFFGADDSLSDSESLEAFAGDAFSDPEHFSVTGRDGLGFLALEDSLSESFLSSFCLAFEAFAAFAAAAFSLASSALFSLSRFLASSSASSLASRAFASAFSAAWYSAVLASMVSCAVGIFVCISRNFFAELLRFSLAAL
mmetsp:Transcript_74394/g.122927  ORF Transcript_74394/g.122927 Transcript_74394/m.122927 type:complete len:260 (-) Transcript_74394:573-1352(-)